MDQFARFEALSRVMDEMNREATGNPEIPYIRLQEYSHYCAVKTFFMDYAWRLHLPKAEKEELLRFFYQDTLGMKGRIGNYDLYAFTFHYLKGMTYRTGNLDTPDDCVAKLDLERINQYRAIREKQARGEGVTEEEAALAEAVFRRALNALQAEETP